MTDQAPSAESDIPGKPTSASRTTLSHIMTHNDTNLLGTVHGGVIMKLVDDAAGAVAGRHSGGPAVTASMDEMVFLEPVRVGDLVHVKAQVNWTGRTSMEVGVRVLAERWNESDPATQVGSAYLVFAAVDADGKPRMVPPVLPETERDKRRYQEAQIRPHPPAGPAPRDHGAAGEEGGGGVRGLRRAYRGLKRSAVHRHPTSSPVTTPNSP
ncbi:acyl-CoA hydrolase [Streptomyces canus]|nr:acyl-CoA hydrolase [Streptomyces canus]